MMMSWWKQAAILVAGIGIGMYGEQQFGLLGHRMSFAYVSRSPDTDMGNQLACKATAHAAVHDGGPFGDPRRVSALSGPGTDEMALQVGQTELALVTALSVKYGSADAEKLAISAGGYPEVIVATRRFETGLSALVMDKATGNAVWVKTYYMLGRLIGHANYYVCR